MQANNNTVGSAGCGQTSPINPSQTSPEVQIPERKFKGRIKPGEVRNTIGRKGHPNKVNKEVKEAFAWLVRKKLDKLSLWIDKAAEKDPAKAVTLVIKLAQYVIPKLSNEHITVRNEDDSIDYTKLSDEELNTVFTLLNKCNTKKEDDN